MTAPTAKTWICDWTHWQGKVLPAVGVANEGFGMVKLKAGGSKQSWWFEDPMFYRSAVALLQEPRLIPGAFWYLVPGRASAQAALFFDLLSVVDEQSWAVYLDVEEPGLSWRDVDRFNHTWMALTGRPLTLYTQKRIWNTLGVPTNLGAHFFPFLEEAHWVPESVRKNPATPYASQQAKAIEPSWWHVDYDGWRQASMIQFTDNALVQGVRTTASLYRGTQAELRGALIG